MPAWLLRFCLCSAARPDWALGPTSRNPHSEHCQLHLDSSGHNPFQAEARHCNALMHWRLQARSTAGVSEQIPLPRPHSPSMQVLG